MIKVKTLVISLLIIIAMIFILTRPAIKIFRILKISSFYSNAQFYRYDYTYDYYCPRAIYISFRSDTSTIARIIKKYKLTKCESPKYNVVSDCCMNNNFTTYGIIEKNLNWWNPVKYSDNRYTGKIDYGHATNRFTLQIDKENKVFIIIECNE